MVVGQLGFEARISLPAAHKTTSSNNRKVDASASPLHNCYQEIWYLLMTWLLHYWHLACFLDSNLDNYQEMTSPFGARFLTKLQRLN